MMAVLERIQIRAAADRSLYLLGCEDHGRSRRNNTLENYLLTTLDKACISTQLFDLNGWLYLNGINVAELRHPGSPAPREPRQDAGRECLP